MPPREVQFAINVATAITVAIAVATTAQSTKMSIGFFFMVNGAGSETASSRGKAALA